MSPGRHDKIEVERIDKGGFEDEEALYKVKKYRKIRNNIVHNNVNVGKRESKDIISCIEKLCASINSGNIIIL